MYVSFGYTPQCVCQNNWWDILMSTSEENPALSALRAFDLCIRSDK